MRRGIAQLLKRTMVAAFVAASGMFVGGCVQAPLISFGPATAMPSVIATNITSPNAMEDNGVTVIRYDPSEVQIMGWFEKKESSKGLNGRLPFAGTRDLFAVKKSDYESTYKEILDENDLDGLMNLTVDTRRLVINLIIVRFTNWHTSVGGVGYRIERNEKPLGGGAEAR